MNVHPTSKRDQLLTDRAVHAGVRDVLRARRVPEADRDDLLQETLWAAHRSPTLPDESAQWVKFACGIARNRANEYWSSPQRREVPLEAAGEEAVAAVPADAASTRDLIEKLTAETPRHRWPVLEWLARMAVGESLVEIAREEGVDYNVAHKRVTTLRRELRAKAAQWGVAVAVLALLVGGAWYVLRPKPETAQREERPVPVAVEPPRAPTPEEKAQGLREEAREACGAGQWDRCEDRLDEAKQLDPAGEDNPLIQSLRRKAQGARHPEPAPHGIK